MGEAKRRGTREHRVAEAIEAARRREAEAARRWEEAEIYRQQRIVEQWNNLAPEEREERLERAKRYATALGGLMHSPVGTLLAARGIVVATAHDTFPADIADASSGVPRG